MQVHYFYAEDWEREYIESGLKGHNIVFTQGSLQDAPDVKDKEAEALSVFVNSQVGKEEIERFPNLKLIATRSTGFDHIDLNIAEEKNIMVMNVPTYGENTVAEFAFALLLALSRKIYDSYERVRREGNFSQKGLRGFDLMGKTIGVVGGGHIGRHAIRMAHGFGMNILVFDINHDDEFAKEIGFEYVDLDNLLSRSDVITLHVPYNKHTHHILNSENIKKIKKGAYLINTARGGLVETDALVAALKSGTLAGAGLDVLEEEGYFINEDTALLFAKHPEAEKIKTVLENHYLIDHPNVIITPHNAFQTGEALQRILDTTIENINAFAAGSPVNVVAKK